MDTEIKDRIKIVVDDYFPSGRYRSAIILYSEEFEHLKSLSSKLIYEFKQNIDNVVVEPFVKYIDRGTGCILEELKKLCCSYELIVIIPADEAVYRKDIFPFFFGGYHREHRIVLLSSFSKALMREGFADCARDLNQLAQALLKYINDGSRIIIKCNKGTSLTVELNKSDAISALVGRFEKGLPENLPSGELFWCPGDSVSGKLILNGVVQNYAYRREYREHEMLECKIKSGRIVGVSDNASSDKLGIVRDILTADNNANRIGKISFGLNRRIRKDAQTLSLIEKSEGVHIVTGTPCPTKAAYEFKSISRLWFHLRDATVEVEKNMPSGQKGKSLIMNAGRYVV